VSPIASGSPAARFPLAARLLAWWQSPRLWMLAASLITRGAGFVSSFVIARLSGAAALGVYAATVNTASSVVSPFTQVMTNNATLMASERGPGAGWRAASLANLIFSTAAAGLSVIVFASVYGGTLKGHDDLHLDTAWLLLAGACVILGQMVVAITTGLLNGIGSFLPAARITAGVAGLMLLAAYPVVATWRLPGAVGLLVFTSLTPAVLLLGLVAWRMREGGAGSAAPAGGAWPELFRRTVAGLPSVGATLVGATVAWTCTIYLVQRQHGPAGVGVVAVGLQWLTLMLMPATSWGGVALKGLLDARAQGPQQLRGARWRLIRRNIGITLAVGLAIAAASPLLSSAYGLGGSGLATLLCLNVGCAVVAGANNIHERLMLCLDRQWLWFAFSLVAFGVQLAFTWVFIGRGLAAVPLGTLSAGCTLWALSAAYVRAALPATEPNP
jgi:O-antigen/teichoic acid export membrane protein